MGYNTLFLRLIPGYLCSARHHRQFHTLPGLLHSQVALPTPSLKPACQAGKQFVTSMARPVREPTTYRMSGGHAYH